MEQTVISERELAFSAHTRRKAFYADIAKKAAALPAPDRLPAPAEILCWPAHVFENDNDLVSHPSRVREIQDVVCRHFRLKRVELLSIRRHREAVMARQVSWYLCKMHTPNSLPDLARRSGGRDHTTVLSGIARVELIMSVRINTSVSPQWSAEDCNKVRDAVTAGSQIISTWSEDRVSRSRYPSRKR